MKIYVASSWRNVDQPPLVQALRERGHEVYDFRNPRPGDTGFNWGEIDPAWRDWTAEQYRDALEHPIAEAGFRSDMDALDWCDVCVLLLPCGRSAHLEAGYCAGKNKLMFVLTRDGEEPELMVKMGLVLITQQELFDDLELYDEQDRRYEQERENERRCSVPGSIGSDHGGGPEN